MTSLIRRCWTPFVLAVILWLASGIAGGAMSAAAGEVSAQQCTFSHGYWKNHVADWPRQTLVLGDATFPGHTYQQKELLGLLDASAKGDVSLILASQLIAARLNVAYGANPQVVAQALARADALLGSLRRRLPYGIKSNTPIGADMAATARSLEDFNLGRLPGSCGPANTPPAANAGPDQTVALAALVTLDGSGSTDADGQPLTFNWSFTSRPGTSAAVLSDRTAVRPTFIADAPGTFELSLIVNDGIVDSAPSTVRVSTQNSRPIANAGGDQTAVVGATAILTGAASSDPDGDPLTFTWSFASRPDGSSAALVNPAAVSPSFVVDLPGQYTIELVVSDGALSSVADSVTVSTVNSAPVARAGQDTTGTLGETITLDGSGSSDVDGDPLIYRWTLVSKPATSLAVLLNDTAVTTSFVIDASGEYVVQLIVNDGVLDSAADTVTVTTLNTRPNADAGPDQMTATGQLVQLDGSRSTDVDGDPLTYEWSLTTVPAGSAAALSDGAAVRPTFTTDLAGTYIAQLIVRDPTSSSDPDTVSVVVEVAPPVNRPPTAEAGQLQTVALGATVQLDGTASSDPDGDSLAYQWSLSKPAGSAAALSDAALASPTFTADLAGTYVAQLIVNDGMVDSAPDTVSISTENSAPVAEAGSDQTVATGVMVQLDGSGSSDADGTPLIYAWSLIARPSGSSAALSNAASVNPTFVADVDGVYVAQLIVGDGFLVSEADTAVITAAPGADVQVFFFGAPSSPAVGGQDNWGITLQNLGPVSPVAVRLSMPVPAGYDFVSTSVSAGSYDAATGIWTVPALTPAASLGLVLTLRVKATGPYDVVAEIVESSAPDPNLANNRVISTVTPNANADLQFSFFAVATTPPVGSNQTWTVQIQNGGPAVAGGIRVRAPLTAGNTLLSLSTSINGVPGGSYDSATGLWTVGSLPSGLTAALSITYRVDTAAVYDLTASIESDTPDPNLVNNTTTRNVTPNPNADLRVQFINFGSGTRQPGEQFSMLFDVINDGPAITSNVLAEFKIPAGFTILGVSPTAGTSYDSATGVWTIGTMPFSALVRLSISVQVNATGPITLRAAISNSSAPDPNLANNVFIPDRINRPPVANAGADQAATTNAVVTLDGSASFDADGDPITFEWVSALRPINSAATLTGLTTVAPSFRPDLPGNYRAQLVVRDSFGVASAPDEVAVSVVVTNSPPAIVSAPAAAAFVQQPYQYDVTATDPDAGDVLAFSLVTAPSGMTIDPSTGIIDWTPTASQAGAQPVVVRVQDAAGLFDAQTYNVQVSSPTDRAPIALDDEYSVRVSESLSVAAPGVTGNDTDESPLSVRLVSAPGNGTALLNADGSFTYTPHRQLPGEFVLTENVNLAARIAGVTVTRAHVLCPRCAIDESVITKWDSAGGPIEIVFPDAVTVSQIKIVAPRGQFDHKISAGIFELIDANGIELYDSGPVEILGPLFDATLNLPNLQGVRRVRFTPTASPTNLLFSSLAELKVIGSALIRREPFVEPNLVQLLPTTVQSNSVLGGHTPEGLTDDSDGTNWYSNGNAGDFVEVTFPLDVTVTELRTANPNGRPDGFNTSDGMSCSGTFVFLDVDRSILFDSGLVNEPAGAVFAVDTFVLPVPNVAGVRHVRYTLSSCTGNYPAGFAGWRVIGTAPVTTPAFGLGKKFQALLGREAHSTPIVVNLTDDNGDGVVDADDIPDIVVPVEAAGDQLTGEIKAVSGADGRELFTAGGPNLVSPWSELAAGDIDGDGTPEIIAVHSNGNQLIAFEHTGELKWVSDANAMPSFNLGSIVYTGAVSIANLDGAGAPEIIVGASVFDSEGRLLGDGRTLNGTTGGLGLRSAISAVGDIDLDGTPELVAGPTAYRLGGGALSTVWQRTDRPDGYAAIANLDDDPHAEIVSVANGVVYILNHDGSDYQGWNAPTHAPLPIPGGGQGGAPLIVDVDGDGRPEIGVAGASNFVLFNRDGSVRWRSGISDRTSNSTGAVAFDLNGDGQVEIIYRDEFFLRIYRGTDGVLLAKTPVGSATWAEEPVVADVDNDGHADIVVASDYFQQTFGDTGIIVFNDVANKWKRTRRIWNQHAYHVTNVNEDATIPVDESAHWLVPGLNAFRTNAFVPGESSDETDSFTYVASDGVLESNAATVRIVLRTPNSPPRFTSTPIASAAAGVLYSYAAQAADPDAGDILTFSLPTAPAGTTIDTASGVIQWTPTADQAGTQEVVVKVADLRGLFALQGFTIDVGAPLTVPDVVGQDDASARAVITTSGLSIGAVTTRHSASVPAGDVISQNPAAGTSAAAGAPVSFVVSLGPPPAGIVPDVVGLTQAAAEADVSAAGFSPAVTAQNNTAVPAGVVFAQAPAAGTSAPQNSTVTIVVSLGPPPGELDLDLDGFTGNQGDCNDTNAAINPAAFDTPGDGIDQNCNGVDSVAGDTTFPAAAIESPAEDAEITMPTDILGIATDDNFLRYRLLVAGVDEDTFIEIGQGTTPVISGVLGTLDPTLRENGMYRIRLLVEDRNGQITADERVYRASGDAKIGAFGLTFVDLRVPVSGVPIAVVRSYDSRVKTSRDFGVGWSLQLRTGKFQRNRPTGTGWTVTTAPGPFGLPCSVINELRSHKTEVRLSDREYYLFQPRLTDFAALVGGCVGTVVFDFVSGSTSGATLDVLGPTQVIYTSGDGVQVFDGGVDTGVLFDPSQVRLTTVDGRVIDFERGVGVTRIEDSTDNVLTITNSGIIHSSGKSIAFARDSRGRIIRVIDPNGEELHYGYNGDDLSEFVDQAGNRTTFVYDDDHNLQEVRDPLGNRGVFAEYDADGRLIAVTDADGARTEFSHDLDGREEIITDALNRPTRVLYDERGNVTAHEKTVTIDGVSVLARSQYAYDANGNETVVVDADDRRVENVWDSLGNQLSGIVDPAGLRLERTATYNASGHTLSETDPNGDIVNFEVDSRGSTTSWTDVDGRTTRVGYDSDGNVTSVTDPDGRITQVTYDETGRVLTRTDALGHTTTYSYDANGNRLTQTVVRTIDGVLRALTTRYEYDALNRVTRVTDPSGRAAGIGYDALGRVASRRDRLGRTTSYSYDATGDLVETRYPDGSTERREYDAIGDLRSVTDREGLVTTFEYDELRRLVNTIRPGTGADQTILSPGGRVMATVAADGARTDYEYDTAARLILMRQPPVFNAVSGTTERPETHFEYDAGGRITAVVDPRGRRREFSYDSVARSLTARLPDGTQVVEQKDQWGRVIRRIDQEGAAVDFEYLADTDRLLEVTLPAPVAGQPAPAWQFTYDEAGNRLSQTDPLGRVTRYTYDELGRLARLTQPGGQSRLFQYDAVGRLQQFTEFDGTVTTFEYDDADRLTKRRLSDGSETTFAYTPGGRRSGVLDTRGLTSYTYDAAGRLQRVDQPATGAVDYSYDSRGRVASITTAGGVTGYDYDALNRLVGVETAAGLSEYGYDTAGNLTNLRLANGVSGDFTYDQRNQLMALSYQQGAVPLESFTYTYTPVGRRASVTDAGATTTFQYDRIGRLVQEARVGVSPLSRTFTYDPAGNRTSDVSQGATTLYAYDVNDRLLSAGTMTLGYDGNGNVSSKNNAGALTTYSWTPDNRLASVTTAAGTTAHQYDADGLRVRTTGPAGITQYLVDGRNPTGLRQVLEERNGDGDLVRRYHYGTGLLSAATAGGNELFYQVDGQQNVRFLTDAAGIVTESYDYDAFGSLLGETATAGNDYLYNSQQADRDTGLYYLRERYYDPTVGRFLGLDPVAGDPRAPLTLHRYTYAGNDPANFADPNGDFFTIIGFSLAGLESGAARAFELNARAFQLCKIKAFKRVASLALSLRSLANGSEQVTQLAGLIGSSVNLGSLGGVNPSLSGSASLRLFQFESPLAAIGGKGASGDVEKVEMTAKFPNVSQMDLEIKGKLFEYPATVVTAGFDLYPRFAFRSVSGGTEVEAELCPIELCGLKLGKIAATFGLATTIGPGGATSSAEIGIKLDVPFIPEIGFTVVKLPDDLRQ